MTTITSIDTTQSTVCRRQGWAAAPKSLSWGWKESSAALTVTPAGQIGDCNPAAAKLLGWRAEHLPGCPVAALIERLPLGRHTPGYNVAYALFQHGAWHAYIANSAEGLPVAVEVAMHVLQRRSGTVIRLSLRAAVSGQ